MGCAHSPKWILIWGHSVSSLFHKVLLSELSSRGGLCRLDPEVRRALEIPWTDKGDWQELKGGTKLKMKKSFPALHLSNVFQAQELPWAPARDGSSGFPSLLGLQGFIGVQWGPCSEGQSQEWGISAPEERQNLLRIQSQCGLGWRKP